MRNPLQDQLLKSGLVSKGKMGRTVHEQAKQRKGKGKGPKAPSAEQVQAQRLRAEKTAHDQALAAERNAQRQHDEARAQARQIIDTHKVEHEGEIAYRFADDDKIRNLWVNEALRAQLAHGTLVIVRHDQSYELLPRPAADKVRDRDPEMIVLDHGDTNANSSNDADDEYYKQFQVPDDLTW